MINPFNVFLHPQRTVEGFMEKPNLPIAVILVVVPSILMLLVSFVYNLGFDLVPWLLNFLVRDLATWVVTGALIYVLVFVIKGWKVEGKLLGVLSAVSLISVVKIVLLVLFLIFSAIVMPNFFELTAAIMDYGAEDTAEIAEILSEELLLPLGELGAVIFALVSAVSLLLVLFALYILYKIIAVAAPSPASKNIVIFIIMLGFFMAISLFLG